MLSSRAIGSRTVAAPASIMIARCDDAVLSAMFASVTHAWLKTPPLTSLFLKSETHEHDTQGANATHSRAAGKAPGRHKAGTGQAHPRTGQAEKGRRKGKYRQAA